MEKETQTERQEPRYDILFICAANVGRSQMAEGFYNHYARDKHAISAAGIQNVGEKYDYHPDKGIVKVMLEKQIDVSGQVIKFVNEDMVNQSREIILFCEASLCPAFLRDNPRVKYVPIEDPHIPGDSQEIRLERFRKTRDEIEKIVLSLI